jgi:hypothetical protein
MNALSKILRADNCRRTRFHDEKGNLVTLPRLLRNGSRAYATGLTRLLLGVRFEAPWISYDARRILEKHLTSKSRVLEFGSGMSTLWYARRAGFVYSIENFEPWYQKISALLTRNSLHNVRYEFAPSRSQYVAPHGISGPGYDLIVVDGDYRSECVRTSTMLLGQGGILYLDNSDKDSGPKGGDIRTAEAVALEFAKRTNATVRYFTDFAPAQMTPNQGLMISC